MRYRVFFLILLFLIFNCWNVKQNHIKKDKKIVSLAPSITKILFRLGLEDSIVGVTDFCEYYGEVEKFVKKNRIKRISGFNVINYENILSIDPDYILGTDSISYENKIQIENIFKDKKVYWFVHPKNLDGIKDDILKIGTIFNKREKAENLLREMDKELTHIQNKLKDKKKKLKVLVEIFYPPFMTAGKNTFISDIVLKAGGQLAINVDENWPTISLENILIADPDIVVKTHLNNTHEDLKILRCYKENKIFIPKDIDIFLQPSYESIFAVKELYEYLYEE